MLGREEGCVDGREEGCMVGDVVVDEAVGEGDGLAVGYGDGIHVGASAEGAMVGTVCRRRRPSGAAGAASFILVALADVAE